MYFKVLLISTGRIQVLKKVHQGIIFDSKLQLGAQVENAIEKSNKVKHAIWLIRNFFNES